MLQIVTNMHNTFMPRPHFLKTAILFKVGSFHGFAYFTDLGHHYHEHTNLTDGDRLGFCAKEFRAR